MGRRLLTANLRPEVNDPVVVKHRYNAFLNTDLDKNFAREWDTYDSVYRRVDQLLRREHSP